MKKILAGLVIAGILTLAAGAQAAVQNIAVGAYKNMAGTPFPETCSEQVTADIVGPQITLNKTQQNLRTGQSGNSILVASGDTIQYTVQFSNTGTDSALDMVLTDTLSFDTIPGQTVSYVQGTATDSGATLGAGKVTLIEYYDGLTWYPTASISIPVNTRGIRWTVDLVGLDGSHFIFFQVVVTSP